MRSIDMIDVYNKLIDEEEKKRLHNIEILDEVEEWTMLMSHYIVTVATRVTNEDNCAFNRISDVLLSIQDTDKNDIILENNTYT